MNPTTTVAAGASSTADSGGCMTAPPAKRFPAIGLSHRLWLPLLTVISLCVGIASAQAQEADKQAPDTMQVAVELTGYGFMPYDNVNSFLQIIPEGSHHIEIKKGINRQRFAEGPTWSGTKDILLKGDYHVTIRAVYMGIPDRRMPASRGDAIVEKKGLTVDISYYYDKKLIAFESTTVLDESNPPKASAALHDTDYIDLLNTHTFEIAPSIAGYSDNGFRFWAAVRDGLKNRDGKYTSESLGDFLKPLERKENRMIPFIHVEITKPEAQQAPAAHPAPPVDPSPANLPEDTGKLKELTPK